MIECSNPSCKTWLHSECIVKEMEAQIWEEAFGNDAETNGEAPAELEVDLDENIMKLVCTGPRQGKVETWRTDIKCPRCLEKIH
jgi:hypothetical protein